jgi:hypothetical protein
MVRARGYRGSASQFRHRVALLRPRRVAEAYLRLRTLPGEQAQVDWAHFGHLVIGRARRPLMAFVMVLSYSRAIYLRFFLNARMASFLAGHTGAFAAFGGVARVLLYDNLKSACPGTPHRGDPLSPDAVGVCRPPPLRAAAGGPCAREQEGARRAGDPVRTRCLLPRATLHRPGGPERTGRRLVRWAAERSY